MRSRKTSRKYEHLSAEDMAVKEKEAKQKMIVTIMRHCVLSGYQYVMLESILSKNGIEVNLETISRLSSVFCTTVRDVYSHEQIEYLNWFARHCMYLVETNRSCCRGDPQIPDHIRQELAYQDYANPEYRGWLSIIELNAEFQEEPVYTEGCFIRNRDGSLELGIRTTTQEAYYQEDNGWYKDWVEEEKEEEEEEYEYDEYRIIKRC